MNPALTQLHLYPFEKLALLMQGTTPAADKTPIVLSIGEPKQPTPAFIQQALITHVNGLGNYPTTKGLPALRSAISAWISRRFSLPVMAVNPDTQVLPVNGTREALFSFVQAVVNSATKPLVVMPNPFYQIYEGAAILAGAEPYYVNTGAETGYVPDFDRVPAEVWQRCCVLFICSPGNPTGQLLTQTVHEKLLRLAQQFDFIIASDECYTELYDDENLPPPGLLQSAYHSGQHEFKRCVMFQSLSKRSNAPGLRSGFVAGDAHILADFFKYRTYHGCPMALPVQYASIAAWQDEAHVVENRKLYRQKFAAFIEILHDTCTVEKPPASFYVWLKIPAVATSKTAAKGISDTEFAQQLFAQQNVLVLPGSYLSRVAEGSNPGENHVRIALVASVEECREAAIRIKHFINTL